MTTLAKETCTEVLLAIQALLITIPYNPPYFSLPLPVSLMQDLEEDFKMLGDASIPRKKRGSMNVTVWNRTTILH